MILRIWDEWKFCYHLVIRLKSYVSLNAIFKLFFMEFQKTLAIANVNDVDSTRVALLLKFIVFEVPYVVLIISKCLENDWCFDLSLEPILKKDYPSCTHHTLGTKPSFQFIHKWQKGEAHYGHPFLGLFEFYNMSIYIIVFKIIIHISQNVVHLMLGLSFSVWY